MNDVIYFTKQTLLIAFFTMCFFCTNGQNNNSQLPVPKIKAGVARISGSISNLKLSKGEKEVIISIWNRSLFTGEERKYETNLNRGNRFSIEIPLECNIALCVFSVRSETKNYGYGNFGLLQDKLLQMNIVFDNNGRLKVYTRGGLDLSLNDMMNMSNAIVRFDECRTWGEFYKMTPKEFSEHELTISLKKRLHFAIDSLGFSGKIKKQLVNDFNLNFITGRLFWYKECAEKSFKKAKQKNTQNTEYTAVEPDKSYYSFLRQYNLNNPQYLYSYYYSDFLKKFLSIEAFKISEIKDKTIESWLTGVKASVKDAIGFSNGLFYDILAANAFGQQLFDKQIPLTSKQILNIKNYYKTRNVEIAKILLNRNDELIKTIESVKNLKVNVTPGVVKEKLMNTLIAKYKGKVVLVDFWATWCSPCMAAMTDMKPIKTELKDKGVVFIYLTNSSSPKPLWQGKIKSIGGEQYYFTANEWEYVTDNFGFKGIPSYLIYDKNGVLKHKFTAYPGTDTMRKMIKELL